jgi:hypothetical protein
VAQLGARFHGMEEVVGSIPTRSTKFPATFRVPACREGRGCDPDQVHRFFTNHAGSLHPPEREHQEVLHRFGEGLRFQTPGASARTP